MNSSLLLATFGAVEAGLSLLEEREKNYPQKQAAALRQRLQGLKRDWYKEYNREPEKRSDAVLDHIKLELRILLGDYTSACLQSAGVPLLS